MKNTAIPVRRLSFTKNILIILLLLAPYITANAEDSANQKLSITTLKNSTPSILMITAVSALSLLSLYLLIKNRQLNAKISHQLSQSSERSKRNDECFQRLYNDNKPESKEDHITKVFAKALNIKKIQQLQDYLASATHVASIILTPGGEIISKSKNASNFCSHLRQNEVTSKLCTLSNPKIITEKSGYKITMCCMDNVLNGQVAIWSNEVLLANWFFGQVRCNEELSSDFINLCQKHGYNCAEFKKFYSSLPLMNLEQFENICKTASSIAEQLSETARQSILNSTTTVAKRKAEHRLKKTEELLLEAQTIAETGSWVLNTETNMLSGSDQFWKIIHLQRPDEEAVTIEESFKSFYPDDSSTIQNKLFDFFIKTTEETTSKDIQYRLTDSPDQTRYAIVSARVVDKTPNGYKILEGTVQDITERAKNERVLKDNEEHLRTIFESIRNGLIVTDIKGIITASNRAAQNITGKKPEELKGNHITDTIQFFESETLLMVENPILKVLESKQEVVLPDQYIYISDTGINRHLTLIASPINNQHGELLGVILIINDITSQYELEQNLLQSRKLESIGKLAGGIAHDFNNLLGGIMGFADLICIHTQDPDVTKYAKHILETSEKAADLTNQLLSFTRKSSSYIKDIDVHLCITKALSIMQSSINSNIDIITDLSAEQSHITSEETQIQNCIINLVINARDAIKNSGSIKIQTSDIELSERYSKNSHFEIRPGNFLKITITDTAQSKSSETTSKILDTFFSNAEGNNSISSELISVINTATSCNGAVEFETPAGGGNSTSILFPLSTMLSSKPNTVEAQPQKTVLLADDQPISLSLEKAIIEECGYKVLLAENGEQALKIYLEKGHIIDLVVLDLVMPIMGGEEATEHLIRMNPDIKIIITSGMDKSSTIDELLLSGKIKRFIGKPFSNTKFHETVNEVL